MQARIKVQGLTLQVPNFVQQAHVSKSWLGEVLSEPFSRSRREYRTILEGLDFDLAEGDRVALLGRNGAGKTTLLRVLSGAFQPTDGSLFVSGSRQALLNLGLGFNPNATVRENVLLRSTAMGMSLSTAADLVDSVLEFAGLQDVAQHRLLTLSSGQRMRLGFSISTSVQHDIMLMDEWFGAGDAQFVDKAQLRMSDRVEGCKIMVLASHSVQMIRQVCNLGLVLDQGRQVFIGPVGKAIRAYKAIYQSLPGYVPKRAKQSIRKVRKRPDKEKPEGVAAGL